MRWGETGDGGTQVGVQALAGRVLVAQMEGRVLEARAWTGPTVTSPSAFTSE